MRLLGGLFWMLSGAMLWASPEADNLARVLRLNDVIAVMHQEGLEYGEELNADLLDGQGGPFWHQNLVHLYDTDRMEATLRRALADGMTADQIAQTVAFFDTKRGQTILTLETSARTAMLHPDVEAIARANYADLAGAGDRRLAAIVRMVDGNDLLERNVAGALTSNLQFYRGLVDGNAMKMSEETMLADVWAQEHEIRDDTKGWLFGFLLLAYRPLGDDDLDAYIAFATGDAGDALNQALFDGFDIMYGAISYDLGRIVARSMLSSDL